MSSTTLLSKPHFFKPLLPGFEDDFLIPAAYSKYLNGAKECEKAMLGSRKGKNLWPVKINGRRFGDGWKQFVEDHGLKIGDFLVFRHEGDLVFYVLIFDRTTCEKEYEAITAIEVEEEEKIEIIEEQNVEQNVPEDCSSGKKVEEQNEVKPSLVAKASSSVLEYPYSVIQLTLNSIKKPRLLVPRKFARDQGLSGRCCSMILKDGEGNCWPAKLLYKSSNGKTYITGGWTPFQVAHKLKTGDSLIVELTRSGKIPVLKMRMLKEHPEIKQEVMDENYGVADSSSPGHLHATTEASNLNKSQPKSPDEVGRGSGCYSGKSQKDKQPEITSEPKATSSLVQQRFFVAKVTSSSYSKSKLYIPERFAKLHFRNKKYCKVVLIDREGRSWPANMWYKASDDQVYIANGWSEFCIANNLKPGDTFVFEFIEKGEMPAFKMYEFKRNHKAGKDQETAFSSTEKPYFYVMVLASSAKNCQIRIPTDFAWRNGLAANTEMAIKNAKGNSWKVYIKVDKNGEVFIRYGWSKFAEENGIKEGDVFMLELIKGGTTPLMNYYAPNQEIDSYVEGMREDFEDVKPVI